MITTRKKLKLTPPQIIEKEGKKEFVVLPYKDYQAIEELLEDYMDLLDLREAKQTQKNQPFINLFKVILDITNAKIPE